MKVVHAPPPDDGLDEETRTYIAQQKLVQGSVSKFFELYGKSGSPLKVEQGLWDAAKFMSEKYKASFEVALDKVLKQAAAQRKAYKAKDTEEQFMKSPENWLLERFYDTDIEKKPKKGEIQDSGSRLLDRSWWTVDE